MSEYTTIDVWLTNNYTTIEALQEATQHELANKLAFYSTDSPIKDWTRVGSARVSITLDPPDKLISNKIDSLSAEIKKTQAYAEAHCNFLRGQINELLAITYQPEAVES